MSLPYPSTICNSCGQLYGRAGLRESSTWNPGRCDICHAEAPVTQPRDFGHLKEGWQGHRTNSAIAKIAAMPGLAPEARTLLALAAEAQRTGKMPEIPPATDFPKIDGATYEDDYDDEDARFCFTCQNAGVVNCYCGGDFCVCDNHGEMPCPKCDRWW